MWVKFTASEVMTLENHNSQKTCKLQRIYRTVKVD